MIGDLSACDSVTKHNHALFTCECTPVFIKSKLLLFFKYMYTYIIRYFSKDECLLKFYQIRFLCSVFLTFYAITFHGNAEIGQSLWRLKCQFNLTCWWTTVHVLQLTGGWCGELRPNSHTIHMVCKCILNQTTQKMYFFL